MSELLVKRQQSFYDLLNGCITWQEEHQITRELQRFMDNLVEIRVDVLKRVFWQQVVAGATPGRTQEHSVEGLFPVLWESEHRDLLLVRQL